MHINNAINLKYKNTHKQRKIMWNKLFKPWKQAFLHNIVAINVRIYFAIFLSSKEKRTSGNITFFIIFANVTQKTGYWVIVPKQKNARWVYIEVYNIFWSGIL